MENLDTDIIIQYALGELSPSEMKRVKSEIEKDPAAQEELKIYQSSLGDLDQKFQEVQDEPIPENIAQRIEEVSRVLHESRAKQAPKKKKFNLSKFFIGLSTGALSGGLAVGVYMGYLMIAGERGTINFKKLENQIAGMEYQIANMQSELKVAKADSDLLRQQQLEESESLHMAKVQYIDQVTQLKQKVYILEETLKIMQVDKGKITSTADAVTMVAIEEDLKDKITISSPKWDRDQKHGVITLSAPGFIIIEGKINIDTEIIDTIISLANYKNMDLNNPSSWLPQEENTMINPERMNIASDGRFSLHLIVREGYNATMITVVDKNNQKHELFFIIRVLKN